MRQVITLTYYYFFFCLHKALIPFLSFVPIIIHKKSKLMKSKILFLLVITLCTISCKKKDSVESGPSAPDFTQLKVGNYWVYEFYKVDTNGIATDLHETDSSYIYKDSIINGIRYYLNVSNPYQFLFSMHFQYPDTIAYRDSSGCLLALGSDGKSRIYFARDDFKDVFNTDSIPGFYLRILKMTGNDSIVTVPAGTFTTQSMCNYAYPLDPDYLWGIRRSYAVYGAGVGKIKHTYLYYSDPDYFEALLVRYHVQ